MLGPLHQKENFLEGTYPTPLKHEISTLPTKWRTFYIMNIFSESPEGFVFFLGLWGAILAHLTARNTSFILYVCPKMRFFPLRIAQIAHSLYFSTKGIFF